MKGICYYLEQHQLHNDQCNFWINCHMFSMKNMILTHKIKFNEKNGHNQLDFEEKIIELIQHILACTTKI